MSSKSTQYSNELAKITRGRPQIRVTGLRQLVRGLERAGTEVSDLKAAFKQISEEAATEQRKLIPVRTSELRDTIRPGNAKNEAIVRTGFSRRGEYARIINYGGLVKDIRPRYYAQRGRRNVLPRAARILEAELNKLIDRL